MPAVLTSPAATTLTRVDPGSNHALTEPTLASAWQAVAGSGGHHDRPRATRIGARICSR